MNEENIIPKEVIRSRNVKKSMIIPKVVIRSRSMKKYDDTKVVMWRRTNNAKTKSMMIPKRVIRSRNVKDKQFKD